MLQSSTVILLPFPDSLEPAIPSYHISLKVNQRTETLVNSSQVHSRWLHICCPNSPHLHHLHAQKHEGTVDVKTWQENSETGSEMNYIFFQIWEKSDFIIFSHFLWVLLPMACDAWAWIRDGHAPIFTVRYCPPCTVSIGIGSVPPFSPPHWDKIPTLTKDLFWWLLSCANIRKYVQISISFRISCNCMAIPGKNTE